MEMHQSLVGSTADRRLQGEGHRKGQVWIFLDAAHSPSSGLYNGLDSRRLFQNHPELSRNPSGRRSDILGQ